MIPRYQRILFLTLVGCILLMLMFLLRGCARAHERLAGSGDDTPLSAPVSSAAQTVTLSLASDADGSITPTEMQVALPEEPSLHARLLLEDLIAQYARPGSMHPLPAGQAIDDLFLLTLPVAGSQLGSAVAVPSTHLETLFSASPGAQVAVVNLHGAFVDHHPSGVVVEELTLDSILGTIHAALPQVEQVRFLVDGHPRETLAGHASLLRAYPAVENGSRPLVPLREER
jgi:hypothetical protein